MIYTHRDISRVCLPAPGPVHRSETRVAVRGAGFRRVDGELLNGEKSMGVPKKWMVYKGKSHLELDDLGVPLFSGNLQMI